MTLDEAIERVDECVKADYFVGEKEHKQLAKWLKELKLLRKGRKAKKPRYSKSKYPTLAGNEEIEFEE